MDWARIAKTLGRSSTPAWPLCSKRSSAISSAPSKDCRNQPSHNARLLLARGSVWIYNQRVFRLHLVKLHRETAPYVIRLPLILVVTRQNLPGLPDIDVIQRSIPV